MTCAEWMKACADFDPYDIYVRMNPVAKEITKASSYYWNSKKKSKNQHQSIIYLTAGNNYLASCLIQRPLKTNPFFLNRNLKSLLEIAHIYVMPEVRNKGIFKYLMNHVFEVCENMICQVDQDNMIARLAFERIGFHYQPSEFCKKHYEPDVRVMYFLSNQ